SAWRTYLRVACHHGELADLPGGLASVLHRQGLIRFPLPGALVELLSERPELHWVEHRSFGPGGWGSNPSRRNRPARHVLLLELIRGECTFRVEAGGVPCALRAPAQRLAGASRRAPSDVDGSGNWENAGLFSVQSRIVG